jgi:hypothetical protein
MISLVNLSFIFFKGFFGSAYAPPVAHMRPLKNAHMRPKHFGPEFLNKNFGTIILGPEFLG